MKPSKNRIWMLVVGLPILLISWALFMDDYVVQLSSNYRYFYSDSGITLEWYPEKNMNEKSTDMYCRGVIPPRAGPDVDGYRVYKRVIVGHVVNKTWDEERPANKRKDRVSIPGYFVINLRTDRIYRGLSKQEWIKRLRSFGINHEPELFKPSRLDEYLGRNKPCNEK